MRRSSKIICWSDIFNLTAARSLALCKRYSFALVACIECLFVPFGTILGVFTIVALSRESMKASFERVQTAAPRTARHGSVGISCTACPQERTLRRVK